MERRSGGFTIIELLFVIVIGSVLMGIAVSGFGNVRDLMATQGAKTAYMTMHQQARSRAVETGETILLVVYPDLDRVVFWTQTQGMFDPVQFDEEFGVDIRISVGGTPWTSLVFMCMTPRGYADIDCGSYTALGATSTMGAQEFDVEFWLGEESDAITVLPLGQLVES